MFALLKQLAAATPEVEAVELTFIQKVKAVYRSFKGKRKFQAMAKAKREEKAAIVKTNTQLADELEARADALIEQSALCRRTDAVESDRLFEEAVELTTQANALRFN
jgi:hypothetical protein